MLFRDKEKTMVFKSLIIGSALDAETESSGWKIILYLENGSNIDMYYSNNNEQDYNYDCNIITELLRDC